MANPQAVEFAAYESVKLQVNLAVPGSVAGATFQLNIWKDGVSVLQLSTSTITDINNGVFYFALPSNTTGVVLGVGNFSYDVWRTDSGNEKRLAFGPMTVLMELWK